MAKRFQFGDLTDPKEVRVLEDALNQIFEALNLGNEKIYPPLTTTDPNGNLSGKDGQLITFQNGAVRQLKQNTDGAVAWQVLGP